MGRLILLISYDREIVFNPVLAWYNKAVTTTYTVVWTMGEMV